MPRFLILTLALLCAAALNAETYSLTQLIDQGLMNSATVRAQELTLDNNKSTVSSAYLDILPDATASARAYNVDANDRYSAGIGISRSISLDEPTYFNIRTSRLDRKNAELTLQNTRKQVVYDVFDQYLSVLQAQKTLEIDRQNLQVQTSIYEQTQIQNRIGRKTDLDLQQSEIDMLDAQIAVQDDESTLRKARENLFRYIGIEDQGFDLAEAELVTTQPDAQFAEPISITKQRNSLQSSKLSLLQSKIQFLPTTSLGFSYDYSNDTGRGKDWFKSDEFADTWTVSLSFSYPLFSFLEHGEAYRRMSRSAEIQQVELNDDLRQVKLEHTQMLRDWETSKQTYDLSLRKKSLAGESLAKAQEEYNLGRLSLIDLDKSRVASLESQKTANERFYTLLRVQEQVNLLLSRPVLGKY
jgi:outer membrane protein TolC